MILGMNATNSKTNIISAVALAKSIKKFDSEREVCVVVDKFSDVPKKHEEVFDYIVELPFGRTDTDNNNLLENFWQVYYCTPFDETIFINTYALVTADPDSLWEVQSLDDMVFFTTEDFTGSVGDTTKLTDTADVEMQKFGGDVVYFKKSERAAEFFKMADPVFKNWRHVYRMYTDHIQYRDFNLSILANLIATMLGEQYHKSDNFSYIDLSQMPASVNDGDDVDINFWMDDKFEKVKVNNYSQHGIFVYHMPQLVDDKIMKVINGNSTTKRTKQPA